MYNSESSVNAVITIDLSNELMDAIQVALEPETKTPSSERSSTVVTVSGNQLILSTEANDVSALRASLNSYLRWVQGIQSILDALE